MLIRKEDMGYDDKKSVHGGQGSARLTYLVQREHLLGSRLLGRMELAPGSSVGEHEHQGETEYYIFLSGTGVANDDGLEVIIEPGDVLVTSSGHSHGLRNTGKTPLEFIVLVNLE